MSSLHSAHFIVSVGQPASMDSVVNAFYCSLLPSFTNRFNSKLMNLHFKLSYLFFTIIWNILWYTIVEYVPINRIVYSWKCVLMTWCHTQFFNFYRFFSFALELLAIPNGKKCVYVIFNSLFHFQEPIYLVIFIFSFILLFFFLLHSPIHTVLNIWIDFEKKKSPKWSSALRWRSC